MTCRDLVIVLDDDPSILRAVQRLLQVHGFDVEAFNTAEAFLDTARLHDATCLVLDIHLGERSGIDLRRQLTQSGPTLPVIFMTALDSERTRKAALEAGCVAFLNKPFPSADLIEAVESTLRRGNERLS